MDWMEKSIQYQDYTSNQVIICTVCVFLYVVYLNVAGVMLHQRRCV